jgi:hypothetical protein
MREFAYPYKKWQSFIPLKIFKELFPAVPEIRGRGYELFYLFSIGWHFAEAPKLYFFRRNMANQSEQSFHKYIFSQLSKLSFLCTAKSKLNIGTCPIETIALIGHKRALKLTVVAD